VTAYNQFTLPRAAADFGLTLAGTPDLFPDVTPVPVPADCLARLRADLGLAWTEYGRSVYLIGPLLREVYHAGRGRVALFAGTRFDVDDVSGLTGVVDFALGLPPQLDFITAPVLMVVEAK
jgi:hypothetical protein